MKEVFFLSLKATLNKIRAEQPIALKQGILQVLIILILGIVFGFLAKYSDTIPSHGWMRNLWSFIKDVSSGLGLWIFLASIIAVRGNNPKIGALNVFFFFVGMLITYYIYSAKLFGFFSNYYFLRWSLIALIAPFAAYVVWFGRGQGWIAALIAALPIGLLAAQGYRFLQTFAAVPGFELLAAIVLFFILPNRDNQQLKVLPFVLAIIFGLRNYDIIGHLIGRLFTLY